MPWLPSLRDLCEEAEKSLEVSGDMSLATWWQQAEGHEYIQTLPPQSSSCIAPLYKF